MTIVQLRPASKRKFDQFGVTEETLEKRAQYLSEKGFLKDSKILFLGDYDLTSLACLHLVKNSELWVADIDSEVLDVIKKESRDSIKVIRHDFVQPLPKRLAFSFDAVFTDPPYTPEGVALFISRAIEALTQGDRARIFLSYGSLDPIRVLAVQETLLDHGLVIEELKGSFNEYLSAKTVGDRSGLYVLRPTAKTHPTVKGEYQGKIYTYE